MGGIIDDRTKVQLFAVLSALPVLIGFVSWLTVVYTKAEAAERANERQDTKIEAQYSLLLDIRDRVIRIESASDTKSRKKLKED